MSISKYIPILPSVSLLLSFFSGPSCNCRWKRLRARISPIDLQQGRHSWDRHNGNLSDARWAVEKRPKKKQFWKPILIHAISNTRITLNASTCAQLFSTLCSSICCKDNQNLSLVFTQFQQGVKDALICFLGI